jgi:hypothetical protein
MSEDLAVEIDRSIAIDLDSSPRHQGCLREKRGRQFSRFQAYVEGLGSS